MGTEHILRQIDLLFQRQKYKEAELLMKEFADKAMDKGILADAFTIYNELLGYYRSFGRYQEALALTDKLLEMSRIMGIEETEQFATCLTNIATAYRAAGMNDRAIKCYERAETVYLKTNGEKNGQMAGLYNNMSLAYQDAGNREKAKECLRQALELIKDYEERQTEAAVICGNIGTLLLEEKQLEEAEYYLHKAEQLYETTDTEDPHYASLMASKGHLFYLKKEFNKSVDCYTKALGHILKYFGENESYVQTCRNTAVVLEEAGYKREAELLLKKAGAAEQKLSAGRRMKGLELSRAYFDTYGRNMIAEQFPAYKDRIAAGLAGCGSECFGYDDELSQDHDYGPSFCLWLTKEDYEQIGEQLQKAYDQLPGTFMGVPARVESSQGGGRVGVFEINDFYQGLIGLDGVPADEQAWLQIPEYMLAAATNGVVFTDPLGCFSEIREALRKGYPEAVRRRKLAESIAVMEQSGMYNYPRCMRRGDIVAAAWSIHMFTEAAMHTIYLLNNQYMPFYKWAGRKLGELPVLSELSDEFEQLCSLAPDTKLWKDTLAYETNKNDRITLLIEQICRSVGDKLKELGDNYEYQT